jgi:hypothetical protein
MMVLKKTVKPRTVASLRSFREVICTSETRNIIPATRAKRRQSPSSRGCVTGKSEPSILLSPPRAKRSAVLSLLTAHAMFNEAEGNSGERHPKKHSPLATLLLKCVLFHTGVIALTRE